MLVLIETLWNVKRYTYVNKGCAPYGINRNIVECKDAELSAQDKANKY